MEVSADLEGDILFVRVQGRIDGANVRQFMETVRGATEDGDRAVIMDFERLVYISSSGLRAVLMTAKSLRSRDVGFWLQHLAFPLPASCQRWHRIASLRSAVVDPAC